MKRRLARLVAICVSVAVGLVLAEGIVRAGDFDWRFLERTFYYNGLNRESLQLVDNPSLYYRPRPGTEEYHDRYGPYSITVNSLGFRGPETTEEKPAGVWRIVCLGGSNVWGAEVGDADTWPASLQAVLDEEKPGRCEVLNLGAPGYVAEQMVVMGREALDRFDPDVLIFAVSNQGCRPFLMGAPVRPYFERSPRLWDEIFTGELIALPPGVPAAWKHRAIHASRLVRLLYAADGALRQRRLIWTLEEHEDRNVRLAREFVAEAAERTRIFFLLIPTNPPEYYAAYTDGTGLDALALRADGYPPEYRDIHPPPYVNRWYAAHIAEWMREYGYLPPEEPRRDR